LPEKSEEKKAIFVLLNQRVYCYECPQVMGTIDGGTEDIGFAFPGLRSTKP